MSTSAPKPAKNPNPLVNIIVNIACPALILNKLSGPDRLGHVWALVFALCVPLVYGIWEFYTTRQRNFVSILGFVSILITGGLGLFQVDGFWFAVKEALIPGMIAIAGIISTRTEKPLIKLIIYNEKVINVPAVEAALDARQSRDGFSRLMVQTTYLVSLSFVISGAINFFMALWIIKAPVGTAEFNVQLGRMTAMSYPIVVVPTMIVMMVAVWMLIRGLKSLTGLETDQILNEQASGTSSAKKA